MPETETVEGTLHITSSSGQLRGLVKLEQNVNVHVLVKINIRALRMENIYS